MNILLRLRPSLSRPRVRRPVDPPPDDIPINWAERRQVPKACAQCAEPSPDYVYMDDHAHYCVECAVMLVLTRKAYPAGRRAEDFAIEQLVRDRLRWAARIRMQRVSLMHREDAEAS